MVSPRRRRRKINMTFEVAIVLLQLAQLIIAVAALIDQLNR